MEVCPAREKTLGILKEHFMFRQWKLKVSILQEGLEPLPRCDQCGMHMPAASIFKNCQSDKCNKATDIILRRRDVEMVERCGEMEFILEGG